MSSRLPPLPKSLTVCAEQSTDQSVDKCSENGLSEESVNTNIGSNRLDEKLWTLRKEMIGLRQLDMSLLSQLNALQNSIHSYRQSLNSDHNQSQQNNGYENIYQNCIEVQNNYSNREVDDEEEDDDEEEEEEEDNESELSDERKDSTDSLNSSV